MKQIDFPELNALSFDALPRGWVFYALSGKQGYLYAGYTSRLASHLQYLKQRDDSQEMISQARQLEYLEAKDGFTALVHFKCFLASQAPAYQYQISLSKEYVYLALDARRYPFVSIQEHTNDDWQYLGPFRSRFFLGDVIDTLSRILKLPFCETGSFPCDKFDRQICRGWCLALAPAEASRQVQDLDKLETLLKEAYLHPNNGIVEMIQRERDKYFNDLEFARADLLDDEIQLLSRYREWLNFLYTAKALNFEHEELTITAGQLARVRTEKREFHFPVDNPEYRENEYLAYPLNMVDEARIIYDHLREKTDAY
ncbi:MAG TPA: hypothetical protein PKI59_01080 [Candidatus Cloacimonadota bacterium]|nr:hypothetical protein [Candidatus Cloacimonadota bacterium]